MNDSFIYVYILYIVCIYIYLNPVTCTKRRNNCHLLVYIFSVSHLGAFLQCKTIVNAITCFTSGN